MRWGLHSSPPSWATSRRGPGRSRRCSRGYPHPRPPCQAHFRSALRLWFWIIEGSLVVAFLLMHFGLDVWDWWRNGERVTGVVVDLDYADGGATEIAIRDPATERRVTVHPNFDQPDKELGDMTTVVVMPGDPSKVATPADLNLYLLCWAVAPLLAVWWPLRCWSRHQMLPSATGCTCAVDQIGLARPTGQSTWWLMVRTWPRRDVRSTGAHPVDCEANR